MRKTVAVYVCPDPGCSHYYGSGQMGDLSKETTGGKGLNFEPTPLNERTRDHCPYCWAQGKRRRCRLLQLTAEVPVDTT